MALLHLKRKKVLDYLATINTNGQMGVGPKDSGLSSMSFSDLSL